MSPFREESINWESGIRHGRILVIGGEVRDRPSPDIDDEIHPQLKGIESARSLISVFELLGKYIGQDYGRQNVCVIMTSYG